MSSAGASVPDNLQSPGAWIEFSYLDIYIYIHIYIYIYIYTNIINVFLVQRRSRKRVEPAINADTLQGGRKGDPQH